MLYSVVCLFWNLLSRNEKLERRYRSYHSISWLYLRAFSSHGKPDSVKELVRPPLACIRCSKPWSLFNRQEDDPSMAIWNLSSPCRTFQGLFWPIHLWNRKVWRFLISFLPFYLCANLYLQFLHATYLSISRWLLDISTSQLQVEINPTHEVSLAVWILTYWMFPFEFKRKIISRFELEGAIRERLNRVWRKQNRFNWITSNVNARKQ